MRQAATRAGDRVWPLPIYEEAREQLRSEIADMMNVGGRPGGAITAAAFLREFTGGLPWAHLDIAGTAWAESKEPYQPKGATGVAVRTLIELAYSGGGPQGLRADGRQMAVRRRMKLVPDDQDDPGHAPQTSASTSSDPAMPSDPMISSGTDISSAGSLMTVTMNGLGSAGPAARSQSTGPGRPLHARQRWPRSSVNPGSGRRRP